MKVLLTGGTSLPGGALLSLLLTGGYEVRCLVREKSPNLGRLNRRLVEVVYGSAGDEESLARALSGVDALIHVAGLEYTPYVLSAARRVRVERILMVGSTSVHSAYEHRSGWRREAEESVRESGLAWTIVRPTMIYGSELDKNIHKLLRFLERSPVFPVFGSGANLWQPVYHEDLAQGLLSALEKPASVHQGYDLPGAEPLSYLDLVRVAAASLGREPRIVNVPLEPARRVLSLAELARIPLPVKSEQVMRLREDKAYPYEKAREELGYAPRAFDGGVALEVARLREVLVLRS